MLQLKGGMGISVKNKFSTLIHKRLMRTTFAIVNKFVIANIIRNAEMEITMNIHKIVSETFRSTAIQEANTCHNMEIPKLTDELYAEFATTGNRVHFEAANFLRRRFLNRLVIGELCESNGRFLPDIEKIISLTLQEKTWVLPAHSGGCLPVGKEENIDLFSSQTAAALAITSTLIPLPHLLQISLWQTIDARIFKPFLSHDYWWEDLGSNRRFVPSNWTPWCIHGVLECVYAARTLAADNSYSFLIPYLELEQLEKIYNSCLASLTNYFEDYPDDGACDEGAQYWEHSVGHFFECGLTKHFSNFSLPIQNSSERPTAWQKLSAMYSFLKSAHLTGHYYMNFADCAAKFTPNASLIFLMGRELHKPSLQEFAAFLYQQEIEHTSHPDLTLRDNMDLRAVLNAAAASAEIENYAGRPAHKKQEQFGSLNAAIFRGSHFCAAAKGGHNGENHNHNDCGNIILYAAGQPLLIDVGVGAYTKDTFSDRRYSIWTMQSSYHNLPEINGYMQRDGSLYKAGNSEITLHSFACDIAGAYPLEAGIRSLNRKLELSKDMVKIISEFEFVSDCNTICFNYMFPDKPELYEEDQNIRSDEQVNSIVNFAGHTIALPSAKWSVEKIEFGEDEKLSPVWGNAVYRLRGSITEIPDKFTAVTTIRYINSYIKNSEAAIQKIDEYYMKQAIKLAEKAAACGDVPIGCVLVKDDKIVSRAYNKRNKNHSVLSHAETLAIEKAAKKQGDFRLDGYTMYVTLEPCQMCAGAIIQSRIKRVVIGAMNPKAGCAGSILNMLQEPRFNHQAEISTGICKEECSKLLTDFFRSLRSQNN